MKYLIVVFLCGLVNHAVQDESQADIDAARKECTASTSVNPDLVQKLISGEFTNDSNLKCFVKCIAVKLGHMTEAGQLQLDNIKGLFETEGVAADKAAKVIAACKDVKGADPCDTAFNVIKCIVEQLKVL